MQDNTRASPSPRDSRSATRGITTYFTAQKDALAAVQTHSHETIPCLLACLLGPLRGE